MPPLAVFATHILFTAALGSVFITAAAAIFYWCLKTKQPLGNPLWKVMKLSIRIAWLILAGGVAASIAAAIV